MSDPFYGEIRTFGFAFAPVHWAQCNGAIMPISQNQTLYSLLSTTYGGDGRTTFGLPELRGRVPMHYGSGPGLYPKQIGDRWGNETTVLNQANLPQAQPLTATTTISGEVEVKVSDSPGNAARAVGNSIAKTARDAEGGTSLEVYDSAAAYTQNNQLGGVAHNLTATTQVTGGLSGGTNAPINNMQPFLALNFCIALDGLYPSRS
jgi:microcystin-dependent protein